MTGELLSADDAHILGLESAVVTGHTLKLLVLAPGAPLDIVALRLAVAARLADEPRATERVDLTDAAGPRWVTAESFDIAQHVRRHGPAADEAAAWALVSELMSTHLDRDRPLWTVDVIGPLDDGREVVAVRLHHAMVDGIAGMAFLEAILLEADEPMAELVIDVSAAPAPGIRPDDRAIPREWLRAPGAIVRELGHPSGRSPFDLPLTAARELAFVSLPLGGLKVIGASRPDHATVNDVLLAVIAGGLHAWLPDREADGRLRAQVPVSLHHRGDAAGNRDSFLDVDLPLGEHDPLRRLDRISAETRLAKSHDDAAVLYDLFHALGRVGAGIARTVENPHEFAVSISNVPGPHRPMSVVGRRVEHLYSSSEPAPRHALRVSAISHADELGVGLCADPAAVPGLPDLAAAVRDAYDDLHHLALGDP